MVENHPRRIRHTGNSACPCEPVVGYICECVTEYDVTRSDPACTRCRGLGAYRLAVGVAPRDSMVPWVICRDHHEGPMLFEADPPGDDD